MLYYRLHASFLHWIKHAFPSYSHCTPSFILILQLQILQFIQCIKYSKLEYCGTIYRSQLCLPGESSIVLVHHYCPSNSSMPKASPVFVHFFLKHCVTYNDQVYEHILLYVSWQKKNIQLVIPLVSLCRFGGKTYFNLDYSYSIHSR